MLFFIAKQKKTTEKTKQLKVSLKLRHQKINHRNHRKKSRIVQPNDRRMIWCDNDQDCPNNWYHYKCAGVKDHAIPVLTPTDAVAPLHRRLPVTNKREARLPHYRAVFS